MSGYCRPRNRAMVSEIRPDAKALSRLTQLRANHRLRQLTSQPGSMRQQSDRNADSWGHHADTINSHGQACRPRRPLHLRSAFQFGELERSQSPVFPVANTLPCLYTPITPNRRERFGLGSGPSFIRHCKSETTHPAAFRAMLRNHKMRAHLPVPV
mgnify:CR=1 FL=1